MSTTFTSQGDGHAAGLQLAKYRVCRIAYDVHIRENAGFCARISKGITLSLLAFTSYTTVVNPGLRDSACLPAAQIYSRISCPTRSRCESLLGTVEGTEE